MMDIDREIAEKWKPLKNWCGDYDVSNKGRVRSWKHRSGRRKKPYIMSPSKTDRGYLQVHLWYGGKRIVRSVHRLVLEAFTGPCPKGMIAAHNNGIKTDNRIGNLRWATPKENIADKEKHGTQKYGEETNSVKLHKAAVFAIRQLSRINTYKQLAKIFNVHPCTIGRVVRGETWKHLK